jgi:parallel beta-helix repeat protein
MANPAVPYILTTDAVVGQGHPILPDVANRPLKDVISKSGINEASTGFTGFRAVFNAKAYGAKGDGVTDDTVALQAAITACGVAGGGTVFLNRGTYLVSAQITIDADNIVLEGDSDDTTIIKVANSAGHQNAVYSTGRSNISIRRLQIDANKAGRLTAIGTVNVTCGLFLDSSTDLRVSQVTVKNTIGGSSGSGVGIAIGGTNNTRVTIENCKVRDCGSTGRASDGIYVGNCTQGLISNCVALNCLDTGFVLEACNTSGITGCTSRGCSQGAAMSSAFGSDSVGNYINGLTVYDWNSAVAGGLALVAIGTGRLVDTVVSNVTMTVASGSGPSLRVWNSGSGTTVGLNITGVRINGATTQGIVLDHASDVIISGCGVRGCASAGIQIDAGCTDVLVDSCKVVAGPTAAVGISTNGGASDVVISNCKITGSGSMTYGIYHYGTSTQIVDIFNTVRNASLARVGSDGTTTPVVIMMEETNDGSLAFGKNYRRFVNLTEGANGFTLDPDSYGIAWGASSRLKAPGGYRHDVFGWTAANTPANQSGVALVRTGGNYVALRSGSLTGVGLKLSANAAGAGATITVRKNGVNTALTVTVAAGSSFNVATAAQGTIQFVAGDVIDVTITTPAGWTSTTVVPTAYIDLET